MVNKHLLPVLESSKRLWPARYQLRRDIMSHNPRNATVFIALISAAGFCSVGQGLTQATNWHPWEALTLFAVAVAAARMKVKLPGLSGTMSVNLPFVLLAVAKLNLAEALLVGCASNGRLTDMVPDNPGN